MLRYMEDRITSKQVIKNALRVAHFDDGFDGFSTGRFLNLGCGHNNQFSFSERYELRTILSEVTEKENTLT